MKKLRSMLPSILFTAIAIAIVFVTMLMSFATNAKSQIDPQIPYYDPGNNINAQTSQHFPLETMTGTNSQKFRDYSSSFPRMICQPVDIWYVNMIAPPGGDGSSWALAFNGLQEAIESAGPCDQIWVASGTYTPVRSGSMGNRTDSFQMKTGVSIYGGFPETGSPSWEERDWKTNRTDLSGEIGDPGTTTDNCYHVFYHPDDIYLDNSAVLDGFTITAGYAKSQTYPHINGGGIYNSSNNNPTISNCTFIDNYADHAGGGVFNDECSPVISGCSFISNQAGYYGGGIGNYSSSNPIISECTFTGNSSAYGGGLCNNYSCSPTVANASFSGNTAELGGGVYNHCDSDAIITQSTFAYNTATESGGGMCNGSSSPKVNGCIFHSNHATGMSLNGGGGIYNSGSSSASIVNCIFSANTAVNYGGGIYNYADGAPAIINCTIIDNTTNAEGGGIFNRESSPSIINSILRGNTAKGLASEIGSVSSSVLVSYCNIEGGYSGKGNIDSTPEFVNPGNGDFRLSSSSPCIDSGTNSPIHSSAVTEDFEGNNRIVHNIVDIGADEWSGWFYDQNQNQILSFNEMVDALKDYLGGDIPYWQMIDVIMQYLVSS